jgi:acetoacetate decarboxylase
VGYVKTGEELHRIEQRLAAPRWSGEWLSIRILTDPATQRRLLPPPLEPADEPIGTATVGRWRSSPLGDFAGGVLALEARFGGITGSYALAMYMDVEPPLTFGREVFGEPKKLATSGLRADDEDVHAWVDRHGVRLLELRARVGADRGPAEAERFTYNYKARTAADGRGLEEDAILTRTRFTQSIRAQRAGTGTLVLTRGPHDPVDEVDVVAVREALYTHDVQAPRCEAVATVPAEAFLPFHYGRQDDWLALDTFGAAAG